MRIAIIAPPFFPVPPVGYGGTETIIDCLARGFQRAGHEVLLCTVGESTCPVPKTWAIEKSDPTRLNWTEVELRHLIHAYEQAKDYDIVFDNTLLGPIFSERYPGLRVVTIHHMPFNDKFRDVYGMSSKRVPTVAISRNQASLAEGMRIERVIHHGLDPESFEFNETPDDYFLFLGRMSPDKGVHTAAKVAREAGVNLKIAARIGNGEGEREYFTEQVEPLLGNGVEYVGEANPAEKQKLLTYAKGLINPIRWPEPFGLVMIEALGSGTPVISFPEGAAPEIVEDGRTGFLCEDEAEMIAAIKRIDEIDRKECREAMEEYFCSDRMVREYISYFEQLMRRDDVLQAGLDGVNDEYFVDLTEVEGTKQTASMDKELTSFYSRHYKNLH